MQIAKNIKIYVLAFSLLFAFSMHAYTQTATNQAQSNTENTSEKNYLGSKSNNIDETLIDFTSFEDRLKSSNLFPEKNDIRSKSLKDLTKEDLHPETLQPNYVVIADDMLYKNWIVKLNSSANTVQNSRSSYAKRIKLLPQGNNSESYVLGVRVHFPKTPFDSHAEIMTPFEIPTYNKNGYIISNNEQGKHLGVINNVGAIKSLKMQVSGRSIKNGIAIRLKDHFDMIHEYFMGYTHFNNWRNLTWKNPNYSTHIDMDSLYRIPLYPREVPYIKFHSIVIYRPYGELGSDVVHYFKKIDVSFDYAIQPELLSDFDINDEDNWGILNERAEKANQIQIKNYSNKIELFRAELNRKMSNYQPRDVKDTNTATNTNTAGNTATNTATNTNTATP